MVKKPTCLLQTVNSQLQVQRFRLLLHIIFKSPSKQRHRSIQNKASAYRRPVCTCSFILLQETGTSAPSGLLNNSHFPLWSPRSSTAQNRVWSSNQFNGSLVSLVVNNLRMNINTMIRLYHLLRRGYHAIHAS
jgi:hypothetical protein